VRATLIGAAPILLCLWLCDVGCTSLGGHVVGLQELKVFTGCATEVHNVHPPPAGCRIRNCAAEPQGPELHIWHGLRKLHQGRA